MKAFEKYFTIWCEIMRVQFFMSGAGNEVSLSKLSKSSLTYNKNFVHAGMAQIKSSFIKEIVPCFSIKHYIYSCFFSSTFSQKTCCLRLVWLHKTAPHSFYRKKDIDRVVPFFAKQIRNYLTFFSFLIWRSPSRNTFADLWIFPHEAIISVLFW